MRSAPDSRGTTVGFPAPSAGFARAFRGGASGSLDPPEDHARPRDLGLLPRQRGGARRGRSRRRGGPGGALLPEEARRPLSPGRHRLLPGRGGGHARRRGLRRLLRQAVRQVRAAAGDLPRLRAARLPVVPDGDPAVAPGEALPEDAAPARAGALRVGLRRRHPPPVRRAPPEPRRQRVLPVAVRRGGHPHDGRRRRVDHDLGRAGPRQPPRDDPGDPLPPLARPPVLGVHVLHRVQGQLRRVQGHGAGALRRAALRPAHPGPPHRREGRTAPSVSTCRTSTTARGCA